MQKKVNSSQLRISDSTCDLGSHSVCYEGHQLFSFLPYSKDSNNKQPCSMLFVSIAPSPNPHPFTGCPFLNPESQNLHFDIRWTRQWKKLITLIRHFGKESWANIAIIYHKTTRTVNAPAVNVSMALSRGRGTTRELTTPVSFSNCK